jgi:hypothetical protein
METKLDFLFKAILSTNFLSILKYPPTAKVLYLRLDKVF